MRHGAQRGRARNERGPRGAIADLYDVIDQRIGRAGKQKAKARITVRNSGITEIWSKNVGTNTAELDAINVDTYKSIAPGFSLARDPPDYGPMI